MSVYPFELRTPTACLFSGGVTTLSATGVSGQFSVLAGHEPMVALLSEGPLLFRTDAGETIEGLASDGLLRADRNGVAVLVRFFRRAGEGDASAAPDISAVREDDLLL